MKRIFLIPSNFRHAPFATVLGVLVQLLMWCSFIAAHVMVIYAMSEPHMIWWSPLSLAVTFVSFLLWNYAIRPLARAEIRKYLRKQEQKK